MKVLLVHGAYQQFGGEDSVVRAEKELLERHGDEVLPYSRHNDEINQFSVAQRVAFFPQTVYSRKTTREIGDAVRSVRPDVAFVHKVYTLISPSVYHELHSPAIPTVHRLPYLPPFG